MAQALERVDYRKQLKGLYRASATPTFVDVPAMNFLMIDGRGDPNTSADYAAAIAALYGVSFTLKFAFKRGPRRIDYSVMPLEGLWWADDPRSFLAGDKSKWRWTMMIMQPDFISRADVEEAIAAAARKRANPSLAQLRLQSFAEGRAAQLLYMGPYADEGPTIQQLHSFIGEQSGKLSGKHHEIYLSDPRRVSADKLKTIIRQPFVVAT
jgi:hypothetical protein